LTAIGFTCGTMGYLSPEQCRTERQLTCQSDVFSLGVTLQECLVGRHPTLGDQQALCVSPRPTAALAPTVPAGLAQLIDSMLELRAAFRPLPGTLDTRFDALFELL
jgi:serine/threonine-protein kinase